MADRKWSELPDSTPQDSDGVALQRGASNFRWTFQGLRTWLTGYFAPKSHSDDPTIHFAESSINHASIQNVGTNTHAQIDSHIGDTTATPHNIGGQIVNAINAHVGAADPHPVYLTQAEGDAAYTPLTLTGNGELLTYAAGTHAKIAPGTNDQILTIVAGLPDWADPPAGGSGEANTQSTPAHTGTNDARLDMTKAGVDLPLKRLVEGANVTLSETADSVTITATPPGGGGGDMLSPVAAVAIGELYSAADTAGIQTQGTGVLASSLALLDASNTFTENFSLVNPNNVRAGIGIQSTGTNQDTTLSMFPSSGSANSRNFFIEVGGGTAKFHGANDAGVQQGSPELEVFHQSGTVLGGATGGDQGAGTLNASGVFIDGAAVSTQNDLNLHNTDPLAHGSVLPTSDEKDAMTLSDSPSSINPFLTDTHNANPTQHGGVLPTLDEKQAMTNAPTAPTAANPFVTVADVGGGGPVTLNEQHSWAVSGDVADDTYPGTFALKDAGETLSTTRFRAQLESGTCNVQFRLNGGLIGAATGVTGTAATTTLAQALADGDRLELDVSGGASPVNLMVTLEMTRTA